MENYVKYKNVFMEMFNLAEDELNDLKYRGIASWDSAGHMALIAEIEDTFDIMMDTDDIIDFSSFEKGKEILAKYDIVLNA